MLKATTATPTPESFPWDQFGESRRLTSRLADKNPVCIVGAGLAGCWTARLLAERGMDVRIIESQPLAGTAASGNPAGIVKPFVTRTPGFAMQFYLAAHDLLRQQLTRLKLEHNCGYTVCGVLQLVANQYPASRHFKALDAHTTSRLAGTHVSAKAGSIYFDTAGWLDPSRLCKALLDHASIKLFCDARVDELEACVGEGESEGESDKTQSRWLVHCRNHSFTTSHVILANGSAVTGFKQTGHLPITPARGQISRFRYRDVSSKLSTVVSGTHYVIPDRESVLVGATFQRGDTDCSIREDDHVKNHEGLRSLLPSLAFDSQPVAGYAGVRATSPDRLPLVGPVADYSQCCDVYRDLRHGRSLHSYPSLPVHEGLYVLAGLGSRGLVTAPMAAALLVDHITDTNDSQTNIGTLNYYATLLNPARFHIRALKRALS